MNASLHQHSLSESPVEPTLGKQGHSKLSIGVLSAGPSSAIPSSSGRISAIPKKPMRPLTAYHLFFQIEREYVIQTMAGDDADESIHDNKVYLDDVPQRYKHIKLLPDWFFGPGKRRKRKHRKQHGKIGFLELSRVISTRWAELEQLDPKTKTFVQKIAREELDVYYREMEEYKELTKDLPPADAEAEAAVPGRPKKKAKKSSSGGSSTSVTSKQKLGKPAPRPEVPISSSYRGVDQFTSVELKNDIDIFLSYMESKAPHLVSPSFGMSENHQAPLQQQQLFGMSKNHQVPLQQQQQQRKRRMVEDCHPPINAKRVVSDDSKVAVSPPPSFSNWPSYSTSSSSGCFSPKAVEVDICDDEIMALWKSHN